MTTRVATALALVLAIAANTQAAKLVVIMTNSGADTTPGAFPPLAPGQKGFLIGIDNSTPLDISMGVNPLQFQDMTFSGANLVQRLAPNTFAHGNIAAPDVQLRTETTLANVGDPVPVVVPASNFAANDSWWWNQAQTVGGQTLTLASQSTGIQGGAPGGPMAYTASYNPSGTVKPGIWRMAYIVANGDVQVSGILAGGTQGMFSFDLASGEVDTTNDLNIAVLSFYNESFAPIPEPSSFVLAALAGSLGLAIVVRRGCHRAPSR